MSDDPFAPPDPYGDGSNLDLALEVEEGLERPGKAKGMPLAQEAKGIPVAQEAKGIPVAQEVSSAVGMDGRKNEVLTKPPQKAARVGGQGCFRCLNREDPLPCCPSCGTLAAELADLGEGEVYHGILEEAALQRKLLIWAPPVVFLLGALFMWAGGDGFVRIFFGMWLHELGHAVTAWITGHFAVPGPWRTQIAADQSIKVTLTIFAGLGWLAFRAWQNQKTITLYVLGAIGLFTLVCTFGVSETSAQTAITFFGDGGMMIFGGALVLTFWAKPGTHIHTSWLRWGFLVIGALAYLDGVFTWWPARKDASVIPYGEIEGVGLSDPTKLVDVAGWSQQQMIDRFSLVILIVAAIVLARWAFGLWQIRAELLKDVSKRAS